MSFLPSKRGAVPDQFDAICFEVIKDVGRRALEEDQRSSVFHFPVFLHASGEVKQCPRCSRCCTEDYRALSCLGCKNTHVLQPTLEPAQREFDMEVRDEPIAPLETVLSPPSCEPYVHGARRDLVLTSIANPGIDIDAVTGRFYRYTNGRLRRGRAD